MKWNIAAECISLAMLTVIWIYSRKGSPVPSLKNKLFQASFLTTFIAMLTNILSTLMIAYPQWSPNFLTWIDTTIYFIATPLMGLAYFCYATASVFEGRKGVHKVLFWGAFPGALYLILVVVNLFTGILFNIDSNGYTQGPLISVTYLIFYFYCLMVVVVVMANSKWVETSVRNILVLFPVIACLVIVVQQFFPDIILSGSAATVALLIIYLNLQNKQISVDYLTGLPNHQAFLKMLDLRIDKAKEKPFFVLVFSLREFRLINDAYGQRVGDVCLKSVGDYLRTLTKSGGLYRYGGDEFALIMENDAANLKSIISSLNKRMLSPWLAGDFSCLLQWVIGVVQYPKTAPGVEGLVSGIEYAVSVAKSGKQGTVCYCSPEMLSGLKRRELVASILKEKLSTNGFEVYYQPIISLKTKKYTGAEALLRIPDSSLGPLYPNEFIPVAEETGILIDMTYQVLEKVCQFINRLPSTAALTSVNVNFSAIQFQQKDVKERVSAILEKYGVPYSKIKVEFTESVLAENPEEIAEFVEVMGAKGLRMGLDDFGTGYSNIVTVLSINFDTVKLDKSLIWSGTENLKSAMMVKSITQAFHQFGMVMIAEGVENEKQNSFTEECGMDLIQGFLYAKPMPEDQAMEFWNRHT